MRAFLFTLLLLAVPLALGQTIYKWVDEDGVVHYSDQPHGKAEKVPMKSAQTYKAPPASSYSPVPASTSLTSTSGGTPYQACAISQPTDGEDLANIESLTLFVQTNPAVRQGDKIFHNLDGALLNRGAPTGPTFTLTPVDRGTHTLLATIRDPQGTVVCQTSQITFNVHQPSLQNPARPSAAPH